MIRETKHLFIDLLAILPKLRNWIESAAEKGFWARNAVQMTYAWMRDGLKERGITRDLKWGIPVPLDGYRNKVFYVWFDAPIGYISITADHTAGVEELVVRAEGREAVPVHRQGQHPLPHRDLPLQPAGHRGGVDDALPHVLHRVPQLRGREVLQEQGSRASSARTRRRRASPPTSGASTSTTTGPRSRTALFTWKDFQEKVNAELIGNLGNLVNRTLQFVSRFYGGALPEGQPDEAFWAEVRSGGGGDRRPAGKGGAARRVPQDLRAVLDREQEVPGRGALEGRQGDTRGHRQA